MKKIYIKIDGIHCNHCVDVISKGLKRITNIRDVTFDGSIALVSYVKEIDKNEIIKIITDLGYTTKEDDISYSKEVLDNKKRIKVGEFIGISLGIISISILIYKIFGFNIFGVIPTIDNDITYGVLFVTGLLTSIHCISMCGGINLMAVLNTSLNRSFKKPVLYNLGRLISYTLMGGIVGLLGKVISSSLNISGVVILITAGIMLLISLDMLGIISIKKIRIFRYKVMSRNSFVIGLLNGFMPCGPLQAMQIYALSTGSFFKGALAMFLFGLGTVPLMLFSGLIINMLKGKWKYRINKVASVMLVFLSIVMLNRGLLSFNVDILRPFNNYDKFMSSEIVDDYQEVLIDLEYDKYQDILLQKGIPVRFIIKVSSDTLTGCNNEIVIQKFGIKQKLNEGINVIEFTPQEEGVITYTCWMNMIKNTIKVIDDIKYFKGE